MFSSCRSDPGRASVSAVVRHIITKQGGVEKLHVSESSTFVEQMKTNGSSVSVSRSGYLHQSKEIGRESSKLKLKTSLLPSLVGCSTGGLRFGLILSYFQIFSPKMQPMKINNKTECLSLLGLNHSAGQGCPDTIVSGQTHWC